MPGSLFCCCLGQWPWLLCGWPGGEPLYPVAIMWPWGLMMMAAYCRFVQVENVWASCWQVCNHFWCFVWVWLGFGGGSCCCTIFWSFSVLVCLVVCLICSQFFIVGVPFCIVWCTLGGLCIVCDALWVFCDVC